jgi:hypothetical protein
MLILEIDTIFSEVEVNEDGNELVTLGFIEIELVIEN